MPKIVISYVTRSPAIFLGLTGTVAAVKCESLSLMVKKAPSAAIRQSQTKLTDLSFDGGDENILSSIPISRSSLLWRQIKTKPGPASKQHDSQVNNVESKLASLQDWQLLGNLSVVPNNAEHKKDYRKVAWLLGIVERTSKNNPGNYQGYAPYNWRKRRNAHYPSTALLRWAKILRGALRGHSYASGT